MSNGNVYERLWKVQAMVNKMVQDGTRNPALVADVLQKYVIDLPKAEPVKKFGLLRDLGIITVPDDYVHDKWLATFGKKNRKKFYYYNDAITDANLRNPTRILKPGDKLHVRAFQQVVDGTTTSEERMTFLKQQPGNVFTGAQGASLVFEEMRDQLPKGKWYASFDEPDRLWKAAGGDHGVPYVFCGSDGDFKFNLGDLEDVWYEYSAFLCFTEVE